jgi:ribosomal protein S30
MYVPYLEGVDLVDVLSAEECVDEPVDIDVVVARDVVGDIRSQVDGLVLEYGGKARQGDPLIPQVQRDNAPGRVDSRVNTQRREVGGQERRKSCRPISVAERK